MTDHAFAPLPHELAAILDDRQTQFRRLIEPQPASQGFFERDETWSWPEPVFDDDGMSLMTSDQIRDFGASAGMAKYAIGDRLWVQETWATTRNRSAISYSRGLSTPDFTEELRKEYPDAILEITSRGNMPRHLSDLTLVVADVRVQRLQEISEADAVAEGIESLLTDETGKTIWNEYDEEVPFGVYCPRRSFRTLWSATYGPEAWNANPWVVATTFTTHHCNIDKMGEAA